MSPLIPAPQPLTRCAPHAWSLAQPSATAAGAGAEQLGCSLGVVEIGKPGLFVNPSDVSIDAISESVDDQIE